MEENPDAVDTPSLFQGGAVVEDGLNMHAALNRPCRRKTPSPR
jgi:hypothetical protein